MIDHERNRGKVRFLYVFLQWTWGLPQNLAGAILTLFLLRSDRFRFREAVVTRWPGHGSMALGMFLFLGGMHSSPDSNHPRPFVENRILIHEYGHTIQSIILGPLYLPVIGLPSLVWATLPYFQRLRRTKNISYYSMYQEKWANHLGARITKSPAPEQKSQEGVIEDEQHT